MNDVLEQMQTGSIRLKGEPRLIGDVMREWLLSGDEPLAVGYRNYTTGHRAKGGIDG